jgi:hypothetical protein
MTTPLTLDLSLHPNPLIALLMSNPGAQLTVHELRAGLGDHVAAAYNLTRMVQRGNLTATPGEDGLLRYGLGRAPARKHHLHATHEGRTLPTDATLHPCPLIALILANPGAAITLPDVRTTLPDYPRPSQRLSWYAAKGVLKSEPQPDGWRGYTLLRLPDLTRRNLTPEEREKREDRVREQRRAQKARSRARQRAANPLPAKAAKAPKPASEKRVRLALTQEQREARDAEKRARQEEERRRLTIQIAREDSAKFLAALNEAPDGLTEAQIVDATGLTRGRIAQVMRHLRDDGQIRVMRQHTADVYQLTRLDLPERPARITPAARLVEAHLSTRPGDSIPYMVGELRLTREVIRGALGTLRALGRLEWKFVEHLPVFRLARPQQEVRNAAD